MGDLASWAGLGIAVGSLIVAVMALVKSSRAQGKANDLQERLVKIEEQREQDRQEKAKKASLRAYLKAEKGHILSLNIINEGEAEAENIRVEIEGKTLIEHPNYLKDIPLPDSVGPHSTISCFLDSKLSLNPLIKITWDDEYEKDRTYKHKLTL